MGDGFTSPGGADPDGGFGNRDSLPPQVHGGGADGDEQAAVADDVSFVGEEVDCRNCVHARSCGLLASVLNSIGEWAQNGPAEPFDPREEDMDDAPVNPYKIAALCEMYQPAEGDDG